MQGQQLKSKAHLVGAKEKREIQADRRHHLRSGGEDKSGGFLGERKGKEKKEERSA